MQMTWHRVVSEEKKETQFDLWARRHERKNELRPLFFSIPVDRTLLRLVHVPAWPLVSGAILQLQIQFDPCKTARKKMQN
jgi:hypothetical protein